MGRSGTMKDSLKILFIISFLRSSVGRIQVCPREGIPRMVEIPQSPDCAWDIPMAAGFQVSHFQPSAEEVQSLQYTKVKRSCRSRKDFLGRVVDITETEETIALSANDTISISLGKCPGTFEDKWPTCNPGWLSKAEEELIICTSRAVNLRVNRDNKGRGMISDPLQGRLNCVPLNGNLVCLSEFGKGYMLEDQGITNPWGVKRRLEGKKMGNHLLFSDVQESYIITGIESDPEVFRLVGYSRSGSKEAYLLNGGSTIARQVTTWTQGTHPLQSQQVNDVGTDSDAIFSYIISRLQLVADTYSSLNMAHSLCEAYRIQFDILYKLAVDHPTEACRALLGRDDISCLYSSGIFLVWDCLSIPDLSLIRDNKCPTLLQGMLNGERVGYLEPSTNQVTNISICPSGPSMYSLDDQIDLLIKEHPIRIYHVGQAGKIGIYKDPNKPELLPGMYQRVYNNTDLARADEYEDTIVAIQNKWSRSASRKAPSYEEVFKPGLLAFQISPNSILQAIGTLLIWACMILGAYGGTSSALRDSSRGRARSKTRKLRMKVGRTDSPLPDGWIAF